MAQTVVQSIGKGQASAANIQLTLPGNVTAGNLVFVAVRNDFVSVGNNITTANFSDTRSGVYSSIAASRWVDATDECQIFWGTIPSNGAYTLTITPPNNQMMSVVVWEVSGSNSESPIETANYGSGTGTDAATGNLVTSVNTLILGMGLHRTTTCTLTPGANYTQDQEDEDGSTYFAYNGAHRTTIPVGAGTYTQNWTLGTSAGWICTAVAIKEASLAQIITINPTNVTSSTATGNGNVLVDGSPSITERGVCWNTSPNPTTANSKATSAGTTGQYTVNISSLSSDTVYYARAYATNSFGTAYGYNVEFDTHTPTTLGGDLLLESGFDLDQESGSRIMLESWVEGGGGPLSYQLYSGAYTNLPKQFRNLPFD